MYKIIKRLMDITLTGLLLIAILPILIILAIIVELNMGHPFYFTQIRTTKGERQFKLIKFRSMTNAKDENGNLQIVPDAAEELVEGVENEDGTVTYTYTLRDMKWSDGEPVTAKDYEFAWKRAANEENAFDYGYMFENVVGYPNDLAVTALDDKTLEVTIANQVAYWNELLAFPTFFPVREDVVANEGWNTDPSTYVCNGMYTMDSWEHNSVITLKKNENHPDAAEVTMPTLKFYLSDDANNMLTNFKNGEWKLIDDVPTNEMAALKQDYPDEFVVAGQIGTYYVCWNINEDLRAW